MTLRAAILILAGLLAIVGCNEPQQANSGPAEPMPWVKAAKNLVSNSSESDSSPVKPDTGDGGYKEESLKCLDQRVMVIMYHDVIPERVKGSEWFDITTEQLQDQIDFVKDNGGTFLSLDDLYDHLVTGRKVPDDSVVLTFDDNYQGVYDYAVPMLKQDDIPYAVFVHTNYVGNQQGHPKMTWDELKELLKTTKLTVGSHTASHPADITKLTDSGQQDEMVKSQAAIDENLGFKTPYIAWADGKYDATTMKYAQDAGYRMAVTMDSGAAEGSTDMLEIHRYPWNKFFDGWYARDAEADAGYRQASIQLADGPVYRQDIILGRQDYISVQGGRPATYLADGRQGVLDFVQQAGAAAGINGGFFAMAAVQSTDNQMIGPCKTTNKTSLIPPFPLPDPEKLRNRPLVMWNDKTIALTPYQPGMMDKDDVLNQILPNYTDCFLTGAWLVVDGRPLNKLQILQHGSSDANDPRHRAFFGVKEDGTVVCGASDGSVSSAMLAEAAADMGCQYAVLLDSGFSTSLVLGTEVLASGHSTKTQPSRFVPHAIVLKGTAEAQHRTLAAEPETGLEAAGPGPGERQAGRRRRR